MAKLLPYTTDKNHRLFELATQTIARGGVLGLPTESYYGLGVNPFDPRAVDALLQIKGRPDGKPILVVIATRAQLSLLTESVSPTATALMDAFWPGPLTIVFPARPSLPTTITGETGRVGVRLTSCEPLRAILQETGPLTGTSANRSGASPSTTAAEVLAALGSDIDLVIDAGTTPGGPPSTVIDVQENVRIIREGAVTRQMLRNMLETHSISLY